MTNGLVKTEVTYAYSITSSYNYNFFANGLLTAPPSGEFYNWITMGERMMYDSKKFFNDVKTYGLYEYAEFEPYGIFYEIFEVLNGKYLKISVEKGVFVRIVCRKPTFITADFLQNYSDKYKVLEYVYFFDIIIWRKAMKRSSN